MDDVAIIDDMAVLALAARPSTGQRQDRGGAEEAV